MITIKQRNTPRQLSEYEGMYYASKDSVDGSSYPFLHYNGNGRWSQTASYWEDKEELIKEFPGEDIIIKAEHRPDETKE